MIQNTRKGGKVRSELGFIYTRTGVLGGWMIGLSNYLGEVLLNALGGLE